MSGFDPDPDDPGSVYGWGPFRVAPWNFIDLFSTAAEAHAAREDFDANCIFRHGSHALSTDRFQWWREDDHN